MGPRKAIVHNNVTPSKNKNDKFHRYSRNTDFENKKNVRRKMGPKRRALIGKCAHSDPEEETLNEFKEFKKLTNGYY